MKLTPPKIVDDTIAGEQYEVFPKGKLLKSLVLLTFPKGGWTKWDQLCFKGPLTVGDLITNLEGKFGFEVLDVYLEGYLAYSCITFDEEEQRTISALDIEEALSRERKGHTGPILIKITGLPCPNPLKKNILLPTIKYYKD